MESRVRADETPAEAVIRVVSEFESRPQTDLPPLAGTVDPDALDALCDRESRAGHDVAQTVTFPYSRSLVTLHGTPVTRVHVADRGG